jgi:hypothetical protein
VQDPINEEERMADREQPTDAETARSDVGDGNEPFRRSGSAGEYDPNGNWAAERCEGTPLGDIRPGMEGGASGARDGGFGPEGGYSKDAHREDAD